ncbi:hypothetical protein DL546_002731 [Coniochaeta pulveracea]|uniref:Autophagy-related protein 101 n=1 Tax=Coniochaeta pulveracea TaxID=177199 RepID=A0A420Y6P1_9PEZI|nr:hypothetical protein DL546_002731 [Coniochaeta pulveracea]
MEPPTPSAPPEFILEAFADPSSIKDVVRGILHTVFFNRFLQAIYPQTREVLDISLPYIPDAELETMIDQRTQALVRQLDAERHQPHAGGGGGGGGGSGRGQVTVQFYERRRRKATAWNMLGRGDEEVCWERWTVKVTVAEPRTETERLKVRQATKATLLRTVQKIVTYVNTHKDHIPPITTMESNPFPYQISINQKAEAGWAQRMGMGLY